MNYTTTINEDLSSETVSGDGALRILIGVNNPLTNSPFQNEQEVSEAIRVLSANKNAWRPVPSAAEELAARKSELETAIKVKRDELFWTNIPYESTEIEFRNQEDWNVLLSLRAEASDGVDISIIMDDNNIYAIDAADFVTLTKTAMAGKAGIRLLARAKINAVNAAEDDAAIDAIDLSAFGL